MRKAKLPANENERIDALNELDILDTLEEQAYDDLTHLAATICGVPISLVSLVTDDRQWFKSHHGLEAKETPKEFAFCAHAILSDDIFYIPNSENDERFKDNPLVQGPPFVKFYAGVPLKVKGNKNIGTLCVIDNIPRSLTQEQLDSLRRLARQVELLLDLRLKLKQISKLEKEKSEDLRQVTSDLESKIMIDRTQEAAKIGSWYVDVAANKCFWSKMTYEIHELDEEMEIRVEDGINYFLEEDREVIKSAVENAIANKSEWDVELRIKTAKGNLRWVRAIGHPYIENNNVVRLEGTFQDITDSRTIQDKISLLNHRLTLALEASMVGVWEWNIKTNELVWDKQMFALYGVSSDSFDGAYSAWEKGLHPEDKELSTKLIQEAVENKSKFDTKFRVVWPNGEIRTIRALAEATYDENGLAVKMIGVNWDITDIVLKEELLSQQKDKLESALKAKSSFLANMSHEIRTPLNGIIGFANYLSDQTLPQSIVEPLNHIKECGDSLLLLINDILDLSKMEAGKLDLEMIPFSLDETVSTVMATFHDKALKKGIEISYIKSSSVPQYIFGDPLRVRQVLFNLVGNSLKFTQSGKIEIIISNVKSYKNNFFGIQLQVKDTGIGISLENQKKLFQSFEQLDSSTSRKFGGTGLGLNICKNLVEMMGGNISVESEESKGSIFSFNFKTKKADSIEIKLNENTSQNLEKNFNPNLKILIVDDNQINIKVAEKLISNLGYCDLNFAKNGQEAVDKVKAGIYQVVFMDVQMPIMDGYEATRIIRNEINNASVYIIGLSANAFMEDKQAAISCGMNDYIEKPLRKEVLSKCLDKANFTIQKD